MFLFGSLQSYNIFVLAVDLRPEPVHSCLIILLGLERNMSHYRRRDLVERLEDGLLCSTDAQLLLNLVTSPPLYSKDLFISEFCTIHYVGLHLLH